ncbi:TPA: hypothetical protein NUW79_003095 [Escherichia coli]|nr:hypothetical protein [Escherichia coli]HCJ8610257.1 hypothetical protein [Escherichia coli]
MAKISYHDHDGNYMTKEAWEEKRQDDSYRLVKKFDNGEVRAFVYWDGEIKDAADTWRDMWKLFHLEVWNYDVDGQMKPDPVEHMETLSSMEEVNEWWEEFLTKWTAAERREVRNSKGTWVETFVEEGNIFGSGAPGVSEAPQTQPDDGEVGAW